MLNIESFSKKFSEYISRELDLDKDRCEIINYGFISLIQTLLSIILVALGGILFRVLIESLLVAFTISTLRKSSGGVHASTPRKCAIFGAIISIGIAILCRNIEVNIILSIFVGIFIFIYSTYTVYKLAPVDSEKKPIRSENKIKRLKRKSLLIIFLYLIIIVINYILCIWGDKVNIISYNLCIYFGMLWQVFSLTSNGHKFVRKIDLLF